MESMLPRLDESAIPLPPTRAIVAMQSVLEVSASVAASLDLDPLLDRILDAIERLVPVGRASITLDVPGRDILRIVKVRGNPDYVTQLLGGERKITGSLTGRAYRERAAFLIDNLLDPEWRSQIYIPPIHPDYHHHYQSGMFVPLVADQCVGTLFLGREGVGQFSPEDLHILTLFAPQVAIAVTNARRYAAVREQARSLQALARTNTTFANYTTSGNGVERGKIATMLAEMAPEVVHHEDTQIWRIDASGEWAKNIRHMRHNTSAPLIPDVRLDEGAMGAAIWHGHSALVNDEHILSTQPTTEAAYPYRIVVPLVMTEVANGALVLGRTDVPFSEEEFARTQIIAERAAATIERITFTVRLQEQNAALIASNRHKDTFLTNMSHELRTPLNAVIGFAQLLADGMVTEEEDRIAAYTDILESGRHLLSMVNNVLDVARVGSGQEHLVAESIALPPVLAAVERMCAPLFAGKSQRFTLDLPDDIPPVRADADRLRQVLLNLLSNAQKFTPPEGKVTMRVGMDGAEWVSIAVTDNGIGIAPEHQAVVFEAFRQVETGYARAQQGTGLGLALTKQLVTLMNGTITLHSTPGEGSTFTVTLPVAQLFH